MEGVDTEVFELAVTTHKALIYISYLLFYCTHFAISNYKLYNGKVKLHKDERYVLHGDAPPRIFSSDSESVASVLGIRQPLAAAPWVLELCKYGLPVHVSQPPEPFLTFGFSNRSSVNTKISLAYKKAPTGKKKLQMIHTDAEIEKTRMQSIWKTIHVALSLWCMSL